MTRKYSCVDLFSGCGGLSLGLKSSGFDTRLAVEKSDMAAETYFHNFIGRISDLDCWRRDFLQSSVSDQAKKHLVVRELEQVLKAEDVMDSLRSEGIDLIAGGPPCQGFSMAGRRNPDDVRNELPWQFLEFVKAVQPRAVIIENVSGMRSDFNKYGKKSPFEELGQALSETGPGYVVQPMLLNARHFGVAQNRPRLFLAAISLEVALSLYPLLGDRLTACVLDPWDSSWETPTTPALASLIPQPGQFGVEGRSPKSRRPVLAPSRTHFPFGMKDTNGERTVAAALAGLSGPERNTPVGQTDYGLQLAKLAQHLQPQLKSGLANHGFRNHSEKVERRFAFYQWASEQGIPKQILSIPKKPGLSERQIDAEIRSLVDGLVVYPAVVQTGSGPRGRHWILMDEDALIREVKVLATKKHSQRALRNDEPAPTVVSLPDDFVHPTECRVPTVRELARFQSFPDEFEFRAKETTGADRRRVEVPQFTQVGNAVPPLLAQALGRHLHGLLERADQFREEGQATIKTVA